MGSSSSQSSPYLRHHQPKKSFRLLSVQFTWQNSVKPSGSVMVGTSPEFEIALYSFLFLSSPRKERFFFLVNDEEDHDGDGKGDQYKMEIVMHRYHRGALGTAYPVGH